MAQVSVLMLDIQDSTPLSRSLGGKTHRDNFLLQFEEIIEAKCKEHHGLPFQRQEHRGDDCQKLYFTSPRHAIACAVDLQNTFRQFGISVDNREIPLSLHLAIHTCDEIDGTPDTSEMPVAARVLKQSTGGQILLSQACYEAYQQAPGPVPFACQQSGEFALKGIEGLHCLYNLQYDDKYRGEPGTGLMDYAAVEAANQYIARPEREAEVRGKFAQTVGRSGEYRLVTIYGEGGMGKSRLAVNCAKQMTADFPGGIVWVSLAFIEDATPASVADAIFRALRLKPQSGAGDVPTQLIAYLKTSSPLLLLLDNAENIAGSEPAIIFLQDLLSAVPQARLLATSRKRIGLGGQEGIVDVNSGLTAGEALELFRVRADENFPVPPADKEELTRLRTELERADYTLPAEAQLKTRPEREPSLLRLLRLFYLANYNTLALELIASWTHKYQTPLDLLANYEQEALNSLTELNDGIPSGDAKARERHRSLEASYHWSWKKLGQEPNGADAQSAFLAAALFPTTFTDESLHAVLGGDDPKRSQKALSTLVNAALVRTDTSTGVTRYRMHWQLQEYGAKRKFPHSDTNDVRPLHTTLLENFIAFYNTKTETHGDDAVTRSAESRAWLDAEWRNVLTAARYADTFVPYELAVWLRLRLPPYFDLRSYWRVWEEVGAEARDAATRASQYTGQYYDEAVALNSLGIVYRKQSRWQEAEQVYHEALAIFRASEDKQGEGQALNNLGVIYRDQRRWQEAEQVCQQSLSIKRTLCDKWGEGQTLCNLGNVYGDQSRWQEAEQTLLSSFGILRALEDEWSTGITLVALGHIYREQSRWQEAEQAYQQSLVIFRTFEDRRGEGQTLNNLGLVYQEQSRWQEAEQAFLSSLVMLRALEDKRGEGQTLGNLAILSLKQDKRQQGAEYARQGIAAAKQTEDAALVKMLEQSLAFCTSTSGNFFSRLSARFRRLG